MTPRIENLVGTKNIGMHLPMSLANNRTRELRRSFMPRRRELADNVDSRFFSMQVYGPAAGHPFELATPFVKWAAVQVSDLSRVPQGYRPDDEAAVD